MKLPLDERPRERLRNLGPDVLSLQELIAIILGSGTRDHPVLELSTELLTQFGGLAGLRQASIDELASMRGMGMAKAIQLKAALALANRSSNQHRQHIYSPFDAYQALLCLFYQREVETLVVLLRDTKGRILQKEIVAIGSLGGVIMHPREVFHPAVRHRASSFILAHNHPSGDPTPSDEDFNLTKNLISCAGIMGIPVDDHIIVGDGKYISLYQDGYFAQRSRY
ncbi:MAG: DNA repair protein RadC [Simkaniaceae bacterium]|nr:DNA repair protein RadC [Simkaniaceae bacterium]